MNQIELQDKLKEQQAKKDEKFIICIIGVSGTGKTTIGKELAEDLICGFNDADEFHSLENKNKMKKGFPLDDNDRKPWLAAINDRMVSFLNLGIDRGGHCSDMHVFTCSALKSEYRELLSKNIKKDQLLFVLLQASKSLLEERLQTRKDHFFNPALLDNQLTTLELPNQAELDHHHFLFIDSSKPVNDIIEEIKNYLN